MTGYAFDRWAVDAPLTGAAVDRSGRYAAFSGGDGAVRIAALDAPPDALGKPPGLRVWRLTRGAVLTLTADCAEAAFLCGTDDGAVFRVHAGEGPQRLAALARAWPDRLAAHSCGLRAVADGPLVRILDGAGRPNAVLGPHPSTAAGLAFDGAGRRLAVSHYNGVTVWRLDGPRRTHSLFHRGSHLNVAWRPDGRYAATATQEKTVHAWDLRSGEGASLGHCFNRVKSLGWSADGRRLLASGNDTVSAWSFAEGANGDGPGDSALAVAAPQMLGRFSEQLVSLVCPHPALPLTAASYNDGGLELVGLAGRAARRPLAGQPANPVEAMAWSPGGDRLIGGDRDRQVFVCRFDSEWLAGLAGGA